ncbi:unnamed protein product [Paramecium octaurelia]|uniref:Uncharacterized protein n=1 Tax=Paramecium octaurelia TaxID=43137 RepID=A0A8S1UNJ5_PAROT|nr:unnamed protein product [Paramecium octaurelia]
MEYKIPNFYQAMPQCSRQGHQENIVYFCVNEQCPKKFEELCVQCLNKRETSHKHSEYLLIENAYNFLTDLYYRQQNKIEQQASLQEAFESIKTLKFKILEIFENMENQIAQLKDRFDTQYHLQQLFKQNFIDKQNKKRFFISELKQLIQDFNKYVYYNFEKSGINTIIMKEFSDYLDDVQKMNFSEAQQDIQNLIQFTKSLNIIKHQQLKVMHRLQEKAPDQSFILTQKPIGFSAISLKRFQLLGIYIPFLLPIERQRRNLEIKLSIYLNSNNELIHKQDMKIIHESLLKQRPTLQNKYLLQLNTPITIEEHQVFTIQICSKSNCSFQRYKTFCNQNLIKQLNDDLHSKSLIEQICTFFITDFLIRMIN